MRRDPICLCRHLKPRLLLMLPRMRQRRLRLPALARVMRMPNMALRKQAGKPLLSPPRPRVPPHTHSAREYTRMNVIDGARRHHRLASSFLALIFATAPPAVLPSFAV